MASHDRPYEQAEKEARGICRFAKAFSFGIHLNFEVKSVEAQGLPNVDLIRAYGAGSVDWLGRLTRMLNREELISDCLPTRNVVLVYKKRDALRVEMFSAVRSEIRLNLEADAILLQTRQNPLSFANGQIACLVKCALVYGLHSGFGLPNVDLIRGYAAGSVDWFGTGIAPFGFK